jgi:hypothetical protein
VGELHFKPLPCPQIVGQQAQAAQAIVDLIGVQKLPVLQGKLLFFEILKVVGKIIEATGNGSKDLFRFFKYFQREFSGVVETPGVHFLNLSQTFGLGAHFFQKIDHQRGRDYTPVAGTTPGDIRLFQQPDEVGCRMDEILMIPAADACHHGVDGRKNIAKEQETPCFQTDTVRAVAGRRVAFEKVFPSQGDGLSVERNMDGRFEFFRSDMNAGLVGKIDIPAVNGFPDLRRQQKNVG